MAQDSCAQQYHVLSLLVKLFPSHLEHQPYYSDQSNQNQALPALYRGHDEALVSTTSDV
jgi:hypothetical protein